MSETANTNLRLRRFCLIGGGGFLIDSGLTLFLTSVFDLQKTPARISAIFVALSMTYFFNRIWTFKDRNAPLSKSFALYLFSQSAGAIINYSGFLLFSSILPRSPIIAGIAFGSSLALVVNFLGADRIAFAGHRKLANNIGAICLVGVAALFLLWPALYNGSPFLFFDTAHYLGLGQSLLKHAASLLHVSGTSSDQIEPMQAMQGKVALTYAGGRSPFYSIPIWILTDHLGLWPMAVFQSICASIILLIFCLGLPIKKKISLFISTILLCGLLTPLPFFVSMLMPDVFAGISLLGFVTILFFWSRLTNLQAVLTVLITAYSASTHASTLALLFILTAIGALAGVFKGVNYVCSWKSVSAAFIPILVAIIFTSTYVGIVKMRTGSTPKNPPYLTARLLADGIGREFLSKNCPDTAFVLCEYQSRKFRTQDDFLWSGDPDIGVFSIAPLSDREAIKDEEIRFAFRVFLDYPVELFIIAAKHSFEQFFSFGVEKDFSEQYSSWEKMNFQELVPATKSAFISSRSYSNDIFFRGFDRLNMIFLLICLSILVTTSFSEVRKLRFLSQFLLSAFLLNALICGGISGVNDRYQARLIWVAPVIAIGICAMRRRPTRSSPVNFKVTEAD